MKFDPVTTEWSSLLDFPIGKLKVLYDLFGDSILLVVGKWFPLLAAAFPCRSEISFNPERQSSQSHCDSPIQPAQLVRR
jgi:hypothetical protein